MEFRFNAEEWDQMTPAERVNRCRILAQEAQTLADRATGYRQALYQQLVMQWKMLAEEMTQHPPKPPGTSN